MDNLFNADESFPFDDIKFKTPRALQGGTYTAGLVCSLNDERIIIQTPKCKTKKGITKTAKQMYCDLLFNQDHSEFIDWLDQFQEKVRELIYENAENWFHESPSMDDIEYNWNNSMRTYKQTNYLVRTFVPKNKSMKAPKNTVQVYDSDQKQLTLDDIDNERNIICILEIVGIKFSSQSFQLDICLRQVMILNEQPIFNKCLIRLDKSSSVSQVENLGKSVKEKENSDEEQVNLISNIVKKTDEVDEEQDALVEETSKKDEVVEKEVDLQENKVNVEEETVSESTDGEKRENSEKTPENNNETTENNNETTENVENNKDVENNSEDVKNEIRKELEGKKDLDKINDLEEIELNVDDSEEIKLKKPNEVYLDIYKEARRKAKLAKKEAIKAYLEAKKIKELYMLDEIDSSSSDSEDDFEDDDELFSES